MPVASQKPPAHIKLTEKDGSVTKSWFRYFSALGTSGSGGVFISVTSFGATGNGSSDDTAAIQAAFDSVTTGGIVYYPAGTYLQGPVTPKGNTTVVIDPGATLLAKGGSPNELFSLSNTVLTQTNMSASSGTALTVTSSAGFVAGDRIIISAGTFTGSGVEEGPIEFNTVASVGAGSITTTQPILYNYAGWGLAGAAPNVKRLGPASSIVANVRFTGGIFAPNAGFNSVYFGCECVENIEIDHIDFNGFGNGIMTGHQLSRLNFHDNLWQGTSITAVDSVAINMATLTESRIVNNDFVALNSSTSSTNFPNSLVLEVTCRDNLIAGNYFAQVRSPGSAAIELSFFSFNNRILDNRIMGADADIAAGVSTLGIRTFANGSNVGGANVIRGNHITDIMTAIGDAQTGSIIVGNTHQNTTLHANSVTVNLGADNMVTPGMNASANITRPIFVNGSVGGLALWSGTATPSDNSEPGSIYMKKAGTLGASVQFRDHDENGFNHWYQFNQPPRVSFANVGAPVDGTFYYVPDGTAASNPLAGGGTGCFAIRQNGAWKGL